MGKGGLIGLEGGLRRMERENSTCSVLLFLVDINRRKCRGVCMRAFNKKTRKKKKKECIHLYPAAASCP